MKRLANSLSFRLLVCFSLNFPFIAKASTICHDVDDNGGVDLRDFVSLQLCYDKTTPVCLTAHDCDEDNDIDGDDFDDFETAMAVPLLAPLPDAPPESAGYPRDWQGALPVAPFSVYNLANGNLHTSLPLVSWDPVGPPVEFTLYHNNASAASGTPGSPGLGFDLGPGWSTSFSGYILAGQGAATVVEDDGTRNVFSEADGKYVPPAGVYDKLEYVEDPPGTYQWVLTRTSQAQRVFDEDGLLIEVRDSSGNAVTIDRDANGLVEYVASAADGLSGVGQNRLRFDFNGDELNYIDDPIGRRWYFDYDGDNRLYEVQYPKDSSDPDDGGITEDSSTLFTYDDDGHIEKVCERGYRRTWHHDYDDNGRLVKISGPYHSSGSNPNDAPASPPQGAYEQTFTDLVVQPEDCVWQRTYTDKRENEWKFDIADERFGRLLVAVHDPLENTQELEYDESLNVTSYTDGLDHIWTATYGPIGNLTRLTSPLSFPPQFWTLTWEAVGDPDDTNFYRLTKIKDPASKWVQYVYADPNDLSDPNDSTLITQVIEMGADPSDPNDPNDFAVTELKYHWAETSARGQLYQVIDENGVMTEYEYDDWGYRDSTEEGLCAGRASLNTVIGGSTQNDAGQATGASNDAGGADWSDCLRSVANLLACLACPLPCKSGGAPARLADSDVVPAPFFNAPRTCLAKAKHDVLARPLLRTTTAGGIAVTSCASTYTLETEWTYDPNTAWISEISAFGPGGDPNTLPDMDYTFEYPEYDADGRLLRRVGPDGRETAYTYDELGRLETVTHDPGEVTSIGVELVYDAAGRLERIDYSNGLSEFREYDNANRLTAIRHGPSLQSPLYEIEYEWTLNNWVDKRTETDHTVAPATATVVDFTYDNRGRLIGEERVVDETTTTYDIAYTYDQLGNRQTKIDDVSDVWTVYDYDVDLPDPGVLDYPTWHNRLLQYRVYDGDPNDPSTDLLRTVKYTYYKTGWASNITVIDEDPNDANDPNYDVAHDLALYYYSHGDLHMALWGKYELDPNNDPVDDTYETIAAREFRYAGPRSRYLAMDYDTNDSESPGDWTPVYPALWTISDGVRPYLDSEIDSATATPDAVLAHFGTLAQQEISSGVPGDAAFFHGDLIGSTNLTTDDSGNPLDQVCYTAFGELLGATGVPGGSAPTGFPRYQYAGRHGYEADLLSLAGVNPDLASITLQHVGFRWYEPDIGRFVQRDPIGIEGGLNVYAYLLNNPTNAVDPDGLVFPIWAKIGSVVIAFGITMWLKYKLETLVTPKLWHKTVLTALANANFNKNWRSPGPRRLPNIKGATCIIYHPLNDGTGRASIMYRDSEGAKQFYTLEGMFPVEQGTYFPAP